MGWVVLSIRINAGVRWIGLQYKYYFAYYRTIEPFLFQMWNILKHSSCIHQFFVEYLL